MTCTEMELIDPSLPTQEYDPNSEAQKDYWNQAHVEAEDRARRGAVGVLPSEGPYQICEGARCDKTCQCGAVFTGDGKAYIHIPPSVHDVDPIVFPDVEVANSRLFAASWELLKACEAIIERRPGAKQMALGARNRALGLK